MQAPWVTPEPIFGIRVRLEPFATSHVTGLLDSAGSLETFQYFSDKPAEWSAHGLQDFVSRGIEAGRVPLVATLTASDLVVGCSSYFDIDPYHRRMEIGFTWIHQQWRGTFVNPEMKLLMLGHGFRKLSANRIQLKTDERNVHSQQAMRKLGLFEEGTLRRHMVMPDGFVRNTVLFSVIADEWPGIESALLARLGYSEDEWHHRR